ncbi:hypothetical protein G5I_08145 [Acromyrmex echinatior]|uniref:Uncharacterized protein n=1 Tax=Acromyrmex echinatior TaxID=103372 RepID=F4WQQ4_ACREC|nr:hypothetical protein G5I_08145 [Acromyrmex echinatior]
MSNTISSKDGPFAETGNSKFETDKLVISFISKGQLFHLLANPVPVSNLTIVMYMDSNFDQKLLANSMEQKLTKGLIVTIAVPNPTDKEPAAPCRNLGDQLMPFLENREKIEENREEIPEVLELIRSVLQVMGTVLMYCNMRDERKNPGAKKWKRGDEGIRSSGVGLSHIPHYVPKHSLSVESVVSAVPSRRMRTSKRTSNSSDRLTSNSDTGVVRPWKIPLFLLCPSQQEWKRGRAIIFIARSAGALTYVAVEQKASDYFHIIVIIAIVDDERSVATGGGLSLTDFYSLETWHTNSSDLNYSTDSQSFCLKSVELKRANPQKEERSKNKIQVLCCMKSGTEMKPTARNLITVKSKVRRISIMTVCCQL